MKQGIVSILLLVLLATGCKKENKTACLQVKVIRVTCASTVLQVLNSETIGQDGWVDSFNNNEIYDNVFSVSNTCRVSQALMKNDVFWVSISATANHGCIICMMWDNPPGVSYDISSISESPCQPD